MEKPRRKEKIFSNNTFYKMVKLSYTMQKLHVNYNLRITIIIAIKTK